MAPFPLVITEVLGRYGAYLLFLLIGFAFGMCLKLPGSATHASWRRSSI